MTHLPDTDLLGGLQRKDSQPGRDGRRWRVVAGVLAVLVGGGALVAGAAALADRVGSGDEGSGEGSAQTETSQTIGPVADFESFARGVDGVSDGDAAVVVQLVADTTGATPRGTADVLLTEIGRAHV